MKLDDRATGLGSRLVDYSEYSKHDAVGLAALVRSGDVKPDELLAAARARAEEVNGRINAVVRELDPPDAGAGDDAPFAGVPFLSRTCTRRSRARSRATGRRPTAATARRSTTTVQRWLDAGLQVFGQTNTPEFGAKGITESWHLGPARNPWNTDHTPGGSSGGTAAAVAAGIVPCAGASDGGGSIRIPASACGLFGLKATRGLVPSGPGEGRAARRLLHRRRDLAQRARLRGDARRDRRPDAGVAVADRRRRPYADEVGREPGRLRIGVSTASPITDPDPEAVKAAADAAELLTSLGHDVVELAEQPFDAAALAKEFLTTWFTFLAFQVAEAKRITGSGDDGFEDDTRLMAALGRATDPVAYVAAVEGRTSTCGGWRSSTSPTTCCSPPPPPPRRRRSAPSTCRRRCRWRRRCCSRPGGQRAAVHADRRPADHREPRLGALHPARQPHRPPGGLGAAPLDRRRPPDRHPAGRARSAPTACCSGWPRSSRRPARGSTGGPPSEEEVPVIGNPAGRSRL